jgi:hypothetical protein
MHPELVGKPKEKRQFGRPGYRWMDNIKLDLKVVVCEDLDWIHLA